MGNTEKYFCGVGMVAHLFVAALLVNGTYNYLWDREVTNAQYRTIDVWYVSRMYGHKEVKERAKEMLSDDRISWKEYRELCVLDTKLDQEKSKKNVLDFKNSR